MCPWCGGTGDYGLPQERNISDAKCRYCDGDGEIFENSIAITLYRQLFQVGRVEKSPPFVVTAGHTRKE